MGRASSIVVVSASQGATIYDRDEDSDTNVDTENGNPG